MASMINMDYIVLIFFSQTAGSYYCRSLNMRDQSMFQTYKLMLNVLELAIYYTESMYYPRRGVLGSTCTGYVPLASPNPYPIIVYSVANYRSHVSHFWANTPQFPTCRNLLTPEIPQMCNPILVTLLAPIENATPL